MNSFAMRSSRQKIQTDSKKIGEIEREKEKNIITDHVNTDVADRVDSGNRTIYDACV